MDNPTGINLQDKSAHTSILEKDPISIIYEFAAKMKIRCQFDLLNSDVSISNKLFMYKLTLGDDETEANGTSKKKAKHQVALKMIELIDQRGIRLVVTEFQQMDINNQLYVCDALNENSVQNLDKICAIKNLGAPVYKIVLGEAEKGTKLYTVSCQVAEMIETERYKSKRQAKNLCAFKILEKLKSIECHKPKSTAEEQCDSKRKIESVETNISEIKQSMNEAISEKVILIIHIFLI